MDQEHEGVEHPIEEPDQEYKRGGALQVETPEYFGAKSALS